jgi:hypothetical protein
MVLNREMTVKPPTQSNSSTRARNVDEQDRVISGPAEKAGMRFRVEQNEGRNPGPD